MKVLMFGDDIRALRREAAARAFAEGVAVGFRTPQDFDPANLEPADEVIVKGDYPEIRAAYGLDQVEKPEAAPRKGRK
jgi:hypothetical protein